MIDSLPKYAFPPTGSQGLTISRRRPNPNGTTEAFFEIHDCDGELLRSGWIVASPRDALLLLGGDKLNVSPQSEMIIVRLLRDPSQFERLLAEAIDPGPPVLTPATLEPSAELLVRVLELGHRAGRAEGYAAGILAATHDASSVEIGKRPLSRSTRIGNGLL